MFDYIPYIIIVYLVIISEDKQITWSGEIQIKPLIMLLSPSKSFY